MAWCGSVEASAPVAGTAEAAPSIGALPTAPELVLTPYGSVASRIGAAVALIGFSFGEWLQRDPRKARGIIFLLVMLASLVPMTARAGFLDTMDNQFNSLTSGWMSGSVGIGLGLFGVLAAATLTYQLMVYVAQNRSLFGALPMFGIALANLAIPLAVMQAAQVVLPTWQGVAGTLANGITGTNVAYVSPSTVAAIGASIGWTLLQEVFTAVTAAMTMPPGTSLWDGLTALFTGGAFFTQCVGLLLLAVTLVVCVGIYLVFCMIAMELLMANLQFYVTLPASAWLLGGHGSPVTANYAATFWGAAIAQLVRFIVVYEVVVIAYKIAAGWLSQVQAHAIGQFSQIGTGGTVQAINQDVGAMKWMLSCLGAAIVLGLLVRRIGDLADAALSGRAALGGAGLVAGAAGMAVVAGGAAAIGAGAGAAASSKALAGGATPHQAAMIGQMAQSRAASAVAQHGGGIRNLFDSGGR